MRQTPTHVSAREPADGGSCGSAAHAQPEHDAAWGPEPAVVPKTLQVQRREHVGLSPAGPPRWWSSRCGHPPERDTPPPPALTAHHGGDELPPRPARWQVRRCGGKLGHLRGPEKVLGSCGAAAGAGSASWGSRGTPPQLAVGIPMQHNQQAANLRGTNAALLC